MPQRFPPLTEVQLDPEQRKLWAHLTDQTRVIPAVSDAGHLVGPYDALLRSPEIGILLAEVGNGLRRMTGLSPRVLEVAVLAVAEHWHCDFEWVVHTGVARELGIPEDIIATAQAGGVPDLPAEDERMAFECARQLLRTGSIDESTFTMARKVLGDEGAVDLIVFVGHFCVIAFVLDTFEVALPGPASAFGHGAAQKHDLQVPHRADTLDRRLPALGKADLTAKQRVLWDAIHATPRPLPPVDADGHLLGPYDVLLRSPVIGKVLGAFGTGLRKFTDVPKRQQEIVVLVAVAHWRCEMLWAAHEPQATAAGIDAQIAWAIRDGLEPAFASDNDDLASLYRFASQLFRTGHVTDDIYAECLELLGDKGLVELVLLAGHYCTQCFLLNAVQVPPMNGGAATWVK